MADERVTTGDAPSLDIQAVIDRLTADWNRLGESGERFDTAIEMFNEALYIAGVARDDLKQLLDLLQVGPEISPHGQGE